MSICDREFIVSTPAQIAERVILGSIQRGATSIDICLNGGICGEITILDNSIISADDIHCLFVALGHNNVDDSLGQAGVADWIQSLVVLSKKCSIEIITHSDSDSVSFSYSDGVLTNNELKVKLLGTRIKLTNLFRYDYIDKERLSANLSLYTSRLHKCITELILFNECVDFSYTVDGKEIFVGNGDVSNRIKSIFAIDTDEQCIPVNWRERSISVNGYIAGDNINTEHKFCAIYLNGRSVDCTILHKAVRDAMKLRGGIKHFYALSITMPNIVMHIDANSRVQLANEDRVYNAVRECVTTSYKHHAEHCSRKSVQTKSDTSCDMEAKSQPSTIAFFEGADGKVLQERLPDIELDEESLAKLSNLEMIDLTNLMQMTDNLPSKTNITYPTYSNAKLLGVLFGKYILLQRGNFFYVIDYIRARKRFYYDLYIDQARRGKIDCTLLPQPLLILPYAAENLRNEECLRELKRYGFEFVPYMGDYLQLRSIPDIFIGILDYARFYSMVFEELLMSNFSATVIDAEFVGKIACDNFNITTREMSNNEVRSFLKTMDKKKFLSMPDGAPITMVFSRTDIERRFSIQ